ncbi:MAG: ATP-binding cassette domain-containing protein [Pseudomonadota bacterium]
MSDDSRPRVRVRNLSKTYRNGVCALADVSLDIPAGVYGLLGKNGAGKSTLMRTLATLQPADAGTAHLDDIDLLAEPQAARRQLGYLPQDMGVYPNMTALETLEYFIGLKGLGGRVNALRELERVNLAEAASQRLDTFSGGMRQRFGIAVAFLGAPRLVIVDEPTAGLDPFERRRFQHLLMRAASNCVLILSSHLVDDIADLADRLAILHEGRVVAEGAPAALVAELNGRVWERTIRPEELDGWQARATVLSWRPRAQGHRLRIRAEQPPADDGFTPATPDLEDLYAYRVGGIGG